MQNSRVQRCFGVGVVGAMVAVTTVAGTASSASAASSGITGSAAGTTVVLVTANSATVAAGPTPSVTLPPDGTPQSNSTNNSAPGVVSTGSASVSTSGVPATGAVTSTSEVNGANVVASNLSTGAIQASCSVGPAGPNTQASVLGFDNGGSTTDLTSNTTQVFPIAGGTATYDESSATSTGGVETATVTALHIRLATGTDIYEGQASCSGPVVTAGPAVSGVTPNNGSTTGGSQVTITGSNLTGATAVDFGGVPATGVVVNSDGSITATSPAHSVGPTDVTVTTPTGTSGINAADVYTYQSGANAAPAVSSLAPNNGPIAGGTPVMISGSGLTGATAVDFGGVAASSFTVNPDGTITAVSPATGAPGSVDVTVTTPGGTSPSGAQDLFTYNGAANGSGISVNGLSPNSGPTAGNTPVTITGSGFTSATSVLFGTTPATSFIVNSDTSISAVSPLHAVGPVDVTVAGSSGISSIGAGDGFDYTAQPSVTSVSPNQGPAGTATTITGNGLSCATGVDFGGVAATSFTVNADGTISAIAPVNAPGTVEVTVTCPSGTSAPSPGSAFTYPSAGTFQLRAQSSVTSVEPVSGTVSGGTPVTISGAGFTGTTAVYFGATPASSFTVNSDGSITAIAPPGTAGTVPVTVRGPGGTSEANVHSTFTYLSPGGASGYWEVARDGGVFSFGDAQFYGSMASAHLNAPVVGMAEVPDGRGYWLVGSDGGVFSFGDAHFYGSTGSLRLNKPIVGIAATADGLGYWLVASDGGVFSFGDAHFYGSTGSVPLNRPVVGMAATDNGGGYWLAASDGGVFAFGDAQYHGSNSATALNKPVVGIAETRDSGGYWLAASDGGVFAFGDAQYHGSNSATALNKPVVGIAADPDGGGYWMDASDGGVFAFGDAPYYGSEGGVRLNQPMIGMAPTG